MASASSDSALVAAIELIVRTGNLDQLSTKTVRMQLESQFGCDLSERKEFLKEHINVRAGPGLTFSNVAFNAQRSYESYQFLSHICRSPRGSASLRRSIPRSPRSRRSPRCVLVTVAPRMCPAALSSLRTRIGESSCFHNCFFLYLFFSSMQIKLRVFACLCFNASR